MTQVGDTSPTQPPAKLPESEARKQLEENRSLPPLAQSTKSTTQGIGLIKHIDPDLEADVDAAALGDLVTALKIPKDIQTAIAELEPNKRAADQKTLLEQLDGIKKLALRSDLHEGDKELLRDAFDQVSNLTAKHSHIVKEAQLGFWETEIPNLSFLRAHTNKGHPKIAPGSMLEKITGTAEETRKALGMSGGNVRSDSGSPRVEKSETRIKRSVSFTIHDTVEELKSLQKTSATYNSDYKKLLDHLWGFYQQGHQATVKTAIATLDLEELMNQAILHKDVKILCLYGFEEPQKKASLLNYFITDKSESELQALLEAGLSQQVNQRDEENTLPLDKAITEGKFSHAELLLQFGADPKRLEPAEKARLLEKISGQTTLTALKDRLQSS